MTMGGIKDGRYNAAVMISAMLQVDPNKAQFDMVSFDGSSSVQKAGQIIVAQFQMVVVTHGTEYVGSLFLTQIFRDPQYQLMSKFVQIVRFIPEFFATFLLPLDFVISS